MIAGVAGGLALVAPKGGAARPTTDRVKESLFGALGPDRLVDASVLDLYAGSGALAIEALSRGATRAVLVDRDHAAVTAMRRNLATTRLRGQARVQGSTVAAFLAGDTPSDQDLDAMAGGSQRDLRSAASLIAAAAAAWRMPDLHPACLSS